VLRFRRPPCACAREIRARLAEMGRGSSRVTARCARCGREFEPTRKGHIYCSRECRHASKQRERAVEHADPAAIDRLFDTMRDPAERVRPDDWYIAQPASWPDDVWEAMKALDENDTVAQRRRWFLCMKREGMVA
jgi:DNA-directed RNA polymerase subunit RPC12/RpoP